ncbi:hypothetical protein [Sorangium sp. So ce426]|uniref:hypothetical protein n=1 Tax=Sorangium sp. So ce426 TaxID=3133312 RepID=UPI003F5C84A3
MPDTQLGQALLDVPMDQIVERMGRAIAIAQRSLDEMSIQTAMELGMSTLDLTNAGGAVVTRSLLELGFLPTFYHFTETTIEVSVALSIRTSETFHVGATLSVSNTSTSGTGATGTSTSSLTGTGAAGPTGPSGGSSGLPANAAPLGTQILSTAASSASSTMFGLTLSADYTRRYDFDSSAASKVTTKMVAVPAPPAFLEALRTNFGIGSGP